MPLRHIYGEQDRINAFGSFAEQMSNQPIAAPHVQDRAFTYPGSNFFRVLAVNRALLVFLPVVIPQLRILGKINVHFRQCEHSSPTRFDPGPCTVRQRPLAHQFPRRGNRTRNHLRSSRPRAATSATIPEYHPKHAASNAARPTGAHPPGPPGGTAAPPP